MAVDVCRALEITNSRQALTRLDDDEKYTTVILNDGAASGKSSLSFVSEAGLYTLVLGSRKSEAKVFKRWITHDVIPIIRKTGGYVANEDLFVETYLKNADEQTKLMFKNTLIAVRKMNEQLELAQPKVEYFDALVDRNLLTSFRDTAKELGIKEKEFINFLIENKFIYRDQKKRLRPYTAKNDGYFQLKEYVAEKNGFAGCQTLITPKGRETFRLLVNAG